MLTHSLSSLPLVAAPGLVLAGAGVGVARLVVGEGGPGVAFGAGIADAAPAGLEGWTP
jgi:hypothetical protein